MPDMNMQTFEELQRHQLVTEFNVQSQSELNDYQVKLDNVDNPTQAQDNLIIGNNGESLPHWNESVDFDTWVKMQIGVSGKRGMLIHGNSGLVSISSGDDTFIGYHGIATSDYIDTVNINPTNIVYESVIKVMGTNRCRWGLAIASDWLVDVLGFRTHTVNNLRYGHLGKSSSYTTISESPEMGVGVYKRTKITNDGTTARFFIENDEIANGSTTDIPITDLGLIANTSLGTFDQAWAFVRKYTAIEPVVQIDTPKNIVIALKSFGRAG